MIRMPMVIPNGTFPVKLSKPTPQMSQGIVGLKHVLSDLTRSTGPCSSCGR